LLELGFFGTSRGSVRFHERATELAGAKGHTPSPLQRLTGPPPRVPRKKFRVWREGAGRLLQCASKVLGASRPPWAFSQLEFEFYGEVGSGLGPTLEFYALVAEALQRTDTGLFLSEDWNTPHCAAPHGLFVRPDADLRMARTLGGLLARSLTDRRTLHMHLSPLLVRVLRGDELVFDDMAAVIPKTLEQLLRMCTAADKGETLDGATIADLGLVFESPVPLPRGANAHPPELLPGGADMPVTEDNVWEYATLVARSLLDRPELWTELRRPFDELLDSRVLRILEPQEFADVWLGLDRRLGLAELEQHTQFDHGFTASSPAAKLLLEVLADFSASEQRAFFRFLTGSPSLPFGGLAALRPRFTVVRRVGSDEQRQLPSAMTCQNFLKLPAYDSKELMRSKLLQAISEGAGAFLFT
jgi:E3 ubiquitin-protein ligase TRIP12